jgi:hypothetical protein
MTMRYQVMTDKYSGGEMVKFYESDDLQDAKEFAIRMCFFNECKVMVFDEKVEEIIRDEAESLIRANPAITTPGECVDAVFSFILENHRSINHIYYSVKREIFEQYLMQICTYVTTPWYDSFCREHSTDSPAYDRDLVLRFIRYELFGACIDFLNQDMPPEANEEAIRLLEFSLKLMKPEAF